MPVRRSEAYDDPLRRASKVNIDKNTQQHVHRIQAEKITITVEESHIEWSNLIFLPFHPVFKMFVLCAVFIKGVLGPLQSVYPIVYCNDVMDHHPFLLFLKYCYWYFCDCFYGIDTFLHIVHRQVTDKAMRREHLPKSAILLLFDILSLIPFFRLLETDPCPLTQLWPNVLAFNEFLVIYRVTQYFSLVTTHSYLKITVGYTIVLIMFVNCVTCFWLLLTEEGFCDECGTEGNYFDWRAFIWFKLNGTDENFATYVYGFSFIYSFAGNVFYADEIMPSAILEFKIICLFVVAGYGLKHFFVLPKVFAESMLRLRRVCGKYPVVVKIIEETQARNPSSDAYNQVKQYYNLLWTKRWVIVSMPGIFSTEIPTYLRIEIKQDLLWPLFYHSPLLRKSSFSFRRLLSEHINVSYRLPGEKLYVGTNAKGNLYYLKSGIIQLISNDDGRTPILSLTSGTIFGDISFLIPQMKKKVKVRCLTYCEIFFVQRKFIIQALHKYPVDRQVLMSAANERIEHAKTLFACKKHIRGLDRNEDEGIAWIKRRWWEIHEIVNIWTRQSGKTKDQAKCELPREEAIYHCAKYIGQLVLCTPTELQTESMFTNFKFPWILNPHSNFGYAWNRIMIIDVILVLCFYPPNLIKTEVSDWFLFFSFWSDVIYIIDLCISLLTAVKKQDSVTSTFSAVLLERFKSFTFMLDILSTVWIENLFSMMGATEYYTTLQFNRLIRAYILFHGDYVKLNINNNPLMEVAIKIGLIQFVFAIVISHVLFELTNYIPDLSTEFFFGKIFCSKVIIKDCIETHPILGLSLDWKFEKTFSEFTSGHLIDTYVGLLSAYCYDLSCLYCKGLFVSYLYLKNKNVTKYQNFVFNLKNFYQHYRIHHDLLKRLDRYLLCHWKYYEGTDVLYTNTLEDEPTEVYWRAQGQVAQNIISGSKAFSAADPALIKELAFAGKFLVLARNARVFVFGVQCKNVTWIVRGFIKSEYYTEEGEMLTKYYGPGSMVSVSSVLLRRASLRSYTAYSDIEILYIPINEFFKIYQQYSTEYKFLENCIKECEPIFDSLFRKIVLKHRDYQIKLRDRIYSTRMSMISSSKVLADIQINRSLPFEGTFWGHPESGFMRTWFLFRTVVVCVSIISASILGGVGAVSRWIFTMVSAFCDCIAWIDIVLKLLISYNDKRGILITDKKKCLANYLSKAFVLDIIGAFPWYEVLRALLNEEVNDDACFLINTVCKFAHIYIVFAYFHYISDTPMKRVSYIMIIKWQIVNVLIVFGASHYFMVRCVHFEFNDEMDLIHVNLLNTCWTPDFMPFPESLDWDDLHMIFALSLSFAECGMLGLNFGRFLVDRQRLGIGLLLFGLCTLFWFITCYTLVLLVLNARGNTLFKHNINQLKSFLVSERVEKPVIKNAMDHFRYCWLRTKGIDIQELTNDRIGGVFRQDLNYYFYKKSFSILDTILKGGESMQRQLASVSTQAFFLPGHDIFREMDLVTTVCIVHRGRVIIYKNQKKVIVLTKGDIFGQLQGTKIRPIRVTATAADRVDLLYIDVPAFQSIISEEVKLNIGRNPQHRNDFMATKNIFIENPYDTIQYLLRGRKTIQLPWMTHPAEAHHNSWYGYWLHVAWFFEPLISSYFVLGFIVLPSETRFWLVMYCIIFILDALHMVNFIAEFFTIDLIIVENKCTHQRVGWKHFKYWGTYLDGLTFLIPLFTLINNDWRFQLARLLRLKSFYDFEIHFCRSFKSASQPILLKLGIFMLTIHFFACGWIFIACKNEEFPIPIADMRHMTKTLDFSQWQHPNDRKGGCARVTRDIFDAKRQELNGLPSFVVPKYWPHDYILSITFVLLIHTQTNIDTMLPVSLSQVYYKVLATFVLYVFDVYIMSIAINYAYTKYRELFQYDHDVKTMLKYLSDCGLYKSLVDALLHYTSLLWRRQKGEKLPAIAYEGPPCLRQDLFVALYIHHLEAPPTFRQLPFYFKRQLAARLQRRVIFPGKCIVREGDMFNITYFIHEGEVEKWYTDTTGDSKMMSVLYTNGYFGCIAGLFVNAGFQFSYYTRTVVDLVYLNLKCWEDLLEGYPEIKRLLLESTTEFYKQSTKQTFGKKMSVSSAGSRNTNY